MVFKTLFKFRVGGLFNAIWR